MAHMAPIIFLLDSAGLGVEGTQRGTGATAARKNFGEMEQSGADEGQLRKGWKTLEKSDHERKKGGWQLKEATESQDQCALVADTRPALSPPHTIF